MKFIGNIQAIAGIHVPSEEFSPQDGASVRDIAVALGKKYKFAIAPGVGNQMSMPTNLLPQILFQSGSLELDGKNIAIGNLNLEATGLSIASSSTEEAEIVVDDVVKLLVSDFHFHLNSKHVIKRYLSNLIVEFEDGFLEKIPLIAAIQNLIDGILPTFPGAEPHVGFKRIGFGRTPEESVTGFENVQKSTFVIERRVGYPFEENRFYCSAPVQTKVHIETIEKIEQLVRATSSK